MERVEIGRNLFLLERFQEGFEKKLFARHCCLAERKKSGLWDNMGAKIGSLLFSHETINGKIQCQGCGRVFSKLVEISLLD